MTSFNEKDIWLRKTALRNFQESCEHWLGQGEREILNVVQEALHGRAGNRSQTTLTAVLSSQVSVGCQNHLSSSL